VEPSSTGVARLRGALLSKKGDFCWAFRPWSVLTEKNWRG
jgi:hypothetical protein